MKWKEKLKEDWYRDNYFPIQFEKDEEWERMDRNADIVYGYIKRFAPSHTGERDCEELKELLKEYEQWEADLISDNQMWWPYAEKDAISGKTYHKMLELQEKRNQLLNKHP